MKGYTKYSIHISNDTRHENELKINSNSSGWASEPDNVTYARGRGKYKG